jgi:hypothetical protein
LASLRFLRPRPYGPTTLPGPGALLVALAAIALAAAGGWLLAAKLTATPTVAPEQPPVLVKTGPAQIRLQAGWQPEKVVPRIPGLDGTAARVYGPADGGSGRMVLTMLPSGAATELQHETVAALRVPLAGSKKAKVGGLTGVSYSALTLRGVAGLADVYVVSTAAGPLAITCLARLDDPLPVGSCPGDVLSITASKPAATDPAAALRDKLPALVTALNAARLSGRDALRSGATSGAQATAASALWHAYATAADGAAAVAPKTGPGARVAPAFTAAASAYHRLSLAAASHDTHAWVLARRDVNAAEKTAADRTAALGTS